MCVRNFCNQSCPFLILSLSKLLKVDNVSTKGTAILLFRKVDKVSTKGTATLRLLKVDNASTKGTAIWLFLKVDKVSTKGTATLRLLKVDKVSTKGTATLRSPSPSLVAKYEGLEMRIFESLYCGHAASCSGSRRSARAWSA